MLQKSIEFGFDVPQNWLFIAMTHWQLDETDKAKEWYDKSLAWKKSLLRIVSLPDAELQGFFAEAAKLLAADTEEAGTNVDAESADSDSARVAPPDKPISDATPRAG